MKFREKPPMVEAVQFNGDNTDEIKALFDEEEKVVLSVDASILLIQSDRRCLQMVPKGDWCIKDTWGGIYTLSDKEFSNRFEQVAE